MTDTNVTYTDNLRDDFLLATGSRFSEENAKYIYQTDRMSRLPYFKDVGGTIKWFDNRSNIIVTERAFGYLISNPTLCNDLHREYGKSGLFITHLDTNSAMRFANGNGQLYVDVVLPWFHSVLENKSKFLPLYEAWRFLKSGTYGGMLISRPLVKSGVRASYRFHRRPVIYTVKGQPQVVYLDAKTALSLAVRDCGYRFSVHT